jgi:hypothetical protein
MTKPIRHITATVLYGPANGESADTHRTPWFKRIWSWMEGEGYDLSAVADPFARNCRLGLYRNDLNPDTEAEHNLEADVFLRDLMPRHISGVIFDPPFSARMADDNYDGFGVNLYATDGALLSRTCRAAMRATVHGGWFLKFGYNTNPPHPAYEMVKLWLINKGGKRNDTLVSLWVLRQMTLDEMEYSTDEV